MVTVYSGWWFSLVFGFWNVNLSSVAGMGREVFPRETYR